MHIQYTKTSISRIIRSIFSGGYYQRPSFGLATAHVCCNGKWASEYLNTPASLKQLVFSVDNLMHHQTKGLCQHSHVVFSVRCVLTKHYLLHFLIDKWLLRTQVFFVFPLRPHSSLPKELRRMLPCNCINITSGEWSVCASSTHPPPFLMHCPIQAHSPHNSITVTTWDCNL